MQDRHVLESPGICQFFLEDHCCLPDGLDPLRCGFPDHAGSESRSRKRHPVVDFLRQAECFCNLSHAVLSQLYQRFYYLVSERLLRVDSELLEDIVLPLDPCNSLIHVCKNRSLQEVLCPTLLNEPAKDILVKRLCDRLPLLFRVSDSSHRIEELGSGIDDLHMHAEVFEGRDDPFRFPLPHDAVIDEIRLEAVSESTVPQHGDNRRIYASG